jgi:hypothetical protein
MVRTLLVLLPVALAASVVNAQLGDFISNLLGGVGRVATQQNPLAGILSDTVTRNTREITSKNWKSNVNVTVDAAALEGDAQEWLLYFTTQPQPQNKTVLGIRNVTYWDGIYNVCPPGSYNSKQQVDDFSGHCDLPVNREARVEGAFRES